LPRQAGWPKPRRLSARRRSRGLRGGAGLGGPERAGRRFELARGARRAGLRPFQLLDLVAAELELPD
jgi:hypothetical protein